MGIYHICYLADSILLKYIKNGFSTVHFILIYSQSIHVYFVYLYRNIHI